MSLAEDGPPECPECEKVVAPTWSYCASCGAELDGSVPEPIEADGQLPPQPPWDLPLDHHDADHLEWAYEHRDTMKAAAELFSATYPTVRQAFIDHGLHQPRRDARG